MVWTIVLVVLLGISVFANVELWSLAKSMKEELLVERENYAKLSAVTYCDHE